MGLVMPAMTLFKDESRQFRKVFFRRLDVWCVVNFANLAEVLFAGRARKPAAVFFYSPRKPGDERSPEARILTFAPLVANQEANRPVTSGARQETWSIVVNASEVREIPLSRAATGDPLPWKIAMWGSTRDHQLIHYVRSQFDSIGSLERQQILVVHEGPQLRGKDVAEAVDALPEVVGKKTIKVEALRGRGRLFSFPDEALMTIDENHAYVRKGRGSVPLSVCRPPHIIVHAARQYSIYSDDFIVVPPRQIGIAADASRAIFLKALALYLSSKFATYYEFFCASQWGVQVRVATLRTLKQVPVPLATLSEAELFRWCALHDTLAASWPRERRKNARGSLPLFGSGEDDLIDGSKGSGTEAESLYEQLNNLVYDSLKLKESERYLIEDLVDVKLQLIDGKVTKDTLRPPTSEEVEQYAAVLQRELDDFLSQDEGLRHHCNILHDGFSAMLQIELVELGSRSPRPSIQRVDTAAAKELEATRNDLRREYGQWLYFDRNLRIYKGDRTFV